MNLRRLLRKLRFGTDLPYRVYDSCIFFLRQLGSRHPLRRAADDGRTPPFFIVGSGRSGNTLLRTILVGSEELVIPPESYVLGPVIREYRQLGFLPWPALVRVVLGRFQFHPQFRAWQTDVTTVCRDVEQCPEEEQSLARVVDGIYRAYARRHMPEAIRWGDKTPVNVFHLPRIDAVFPGASYVHIVRDGRDVVASYLDAGFYDTVDAACDRWIESVDLVRRFGRRLPSGRFLEIRYERLVREPEAVTRRVCRHLGVPYRPHLLRHGDRVDKLGDTRAEHHAGLYRPIDDRSVGAWREGLDADQRQIVEERLHSRLSALGYAD